MKPMDAAQALQVLSVLMRVLSMRALLFVATLMTFGLFSWAMIRGSWLAFGIASAFCIGVLWPLLIAGYLQMRGESK